MGLQIVSPQIHIDARDRITISAASPPLFASRIARRPDAPTIVMNIPAYDAVIIPGGGLAASGLPHPWVTARLDLALTLSDRTRYFLVLSRGTPHRPPPLSPAGFPIDEASASALYLLARGIDASRILLDSWSLDTIGNAYFARLMICQPLGLSRLCVITSGFHMPRARAVFEWVFGLDAGGYILEYVESADKGLDKGSLDARKEKEASGLRTLVEETVPRVRSMRELAVFVMRDHGAYSAAGAANERKPAVDEKTSASY